MSPNFILSTYSSLPLLPQSLVKHEGIEYGMLRDGAGSRLAILAANTTLPLDAFSGEMSPSTHHTLIIGQLTPQNAAALRARLPWLRPQTLGLKTSAGMGDRLGLATPGHVRAVRFCGGKIAPIFVQQSIREMVRTGRLPQQVMDDAVWGIFQENWQGGFGADADHLKTTEDIDRCFAAGFTFFTLDPGDWVDHRAQTASLSELRELAEVLPAEIQINASGLLNRTLKIEHLTICLDELTLRKAMVKYGPAIWHVVTLFNHLSQAASGKPWELEISVDETAQPTSHAEHVYIASELQRLGVRWVSLAPRFIGDFEKGVDYIGDTAAFEQDIAGHAAIARHFGPYKLSLHSGSDKFSIYPAAMRQTQGLVHLKTAGTSYLEALRTIAQLNENLFREIYHFARSCYEHDRRSYHVSAQLSRAPQLEKTTNLTALLEQFDAREILHVTFGSVLRAQAADGSPQFFDRLMKVLREQPEAYAHNLEHHFIKHLTPFTQ